MMVLLVAVVGVGMGVSGGVGIGSGDGVGVGVGGGIGVDSSEHAVGHGGGTVDQVGTADRDRAWGTPGVSSGSRQSYGHEGGGGNHEPRIVTGRESKW